MQDEKFEWDDEKADANVREHAVSFAQAVAAFGDPLAVEWIDEREATVRSDRCSSAWFAVRY